MTESIRALIVILFLSGSMMWLLAKPLTEIFPRAEFSRMRNTWIALVISAFLAPDFWVFTAAAITILVVFVPARPEQRIIYYFLLLCTLPNIVDIIPGFGGINYIFSLTYSRLLILSLIAPLLFNIRQHNPQSAALFRLPSDKFVVLYILLNAILMFRDNTATNALRETFLLCIDIFAPYYTISRYINSLNQFNRALSALIITIIPIALIGIFEAVKYWHIYNIVVYKISMSAMALYDVRAGVLRATSVFYSPITLGYVMVIGFGILLYLQPLIKWRQRYYPFLAIVLLGLLATVARGPWLGLVVLMVTYLWTGREKIKNFTMSLAALIMTVPFLSLTPFWDKFIDVLPFVGNIRAETVTHRQSLIEVAWILFQRKPLFGSPTYRQTPEMESLRDGMGIIDVVNSYINIALENGLVGLCLFVLIFAGLLLRTYLTIKRLPRDETDLIRLGRILFSIMCAILFIIATVSSIEHIPVFYWAFAGLMAAYIPLAKQAINNKRFTSNGS